MYFLGYVNVQQYPKIVSITSSITGINTVRLQWVEGTTPFLIEVGDSLRISGMRNSKGLNKNIQQNWNGDYDVMEIDPNDNTIFKFEFKPTYSGIDTYLGWNNPQGNLRALVSKRYVQ